MLLPKGLISEEQSNCPIPTDFLWRKAQVRIDVQRSSDNHFPSMLSPQLCSLVSPQIIPWSGCPPRLSSRVFEEEEKVDEEDPRHFPK
ncbi:hypothetical protein TNCV_1246821 [Trichonephila clavipes]|uniref:Uncharacterized protein n=1 Tax=Trichonephila clavipes TaxID=2585209 RepID=A0A8X6REV0_TRICX|nr:hypothetical protein TNCV_1246821 [Trichonephila clavipes]